MKEPKVRSLDEAAKAALQGLPLASKKPPQSAMRALPTVPSAPLRAPPCPGAHNRSRGRDGLVALCAVAWRQGFAEAKESRPKRLKVKTLPKDLVGTVYRNAAGRIEIGASRYDHWFDGDGYVFGLSMDGQAQQAAFAGRFVRTERCPERQKENIC